MKNDPMFTILAAAILAAVALAFATAAHTPDTAELALAATSTSLAPVR